MTRKMLIIGPDHKANLSYAVDFSLQFEPEEIKFISVYRRDIQNPFLFSPCEINTKVLVIHGIESLSALIQLNDRIREVVKVDIQYEKGYTINPKIILVCEKEVRVKNLAPLFKCALELLFEIIEINH
jgi:hypothetical protein